MQTNHLKYSIVEARKVMKQTTYLFYQQKNKEGFQKLDYTLNALLQVVNEIINFQSGNNEKLVEEQILNVVLTEAMKAIEQKDTILLADILTYEIDDMLEECLKRL